MRQAFSVFFWYICPSRQLGYIHVLIIVTNDTMNLVMKRSLQDGDFFAHDKISLGSSVGQDVTILLVLTSNLQQFSCLRYQRELPK